MKYEIGDTVTDEDGHKGIVGIIWDDNDICTIEHDAAHPNPRLITGRPDREARVCTNWISCPGPEPGCIEFCSRYKPRLLNFTLGGFL